LLTRMRFVAEAADDGPRSQAERTRGLKFYTNPSVRVPSRPRQMRMKGMHGVQGSSRPIADGDTVLSRIAHAAHLPTLDEALKALEDMPTGNGGGRPSLGSPAPAPSMPTGNGGAQAVSTQRMSSSGGGQTMRLIQTSPAEYAAPPQS